MNASPPLPLALVLHAHLPDGRRPDLAASLEETWFFEALSECYLPLIALLDRLRADAVPARLTLSVSPTLLGMLQDRDLLGRYRRRVEATIALAQRDAAHGPEGARHVAAWHAQWLGETLRLLDERCRGDVVGVLGECAARGELELATTAATHALLPAHQAHPGTIRAQIGIGIDAFERAFGRRPEFFWLPECAWFPGLDETLAAFGVRVVALESHGVLRARPPAPGVRTPVVCPSGLRAVARDPALSRLVWSAAHGYPGDPAYREFHRDRIHDLDAGEVARWLDDPSAPRLPSGLKYWRVTGPAADKAWYEPEAATARAREHARDFVARVAATRGESGVCLVPFDAELFGHWWFEGPLWIETVFRQLASRREEVVPGTITRAALDCPSAHAAQPAASSWGEGGDYSYWINHDTAWLYPVLMDAADRLDRLLARPDAAGADSLAHRTLRQAARTLLLAQSSDWPFLVRAGTASEAGTARLTALLGRFESLCAMLEADRIDPAHLAGCERLDAAFPDLDLRWFGAAGDPGGRASRPSGA